MNTAVTMTGYMTRLAGFSALDSYLGLKPLPSLCIETDADPGALARLFEDIRYPGASLADAALDLGSDHQGTLYFRCVEKNAPSSMGGFYQDWTSGRFHDPQGLYPLLKALKSAERGSQKQELFPEDLFRHLFIRSGPIGSAPGQTELWENAFAMALFFARYCGAVSPGSVKALMKEGVAFLESLPPSPLPLVEAQRTLLNSLLLSAQSSLGFSFLKLSGLLETLWPELADLDRASHSKEYHPEGNAWEHTLETFRYRKTEDLILSLGLLLHDTGKPLSASSGKHRFDGHAELGARIASKFLSRLEYDSRIIDSVFYLVKNHMLPAALPRLPLSRTREILESPLFPTLMELYRCDESSSFKGLDGYYQSSAAYHAYLRNRRNPYRPANGRRIGVRRP
ncbi:MAG: HD domain-containing protein [Spirochaetaceae bacterium]|jgi:poly(A) polymerase|nr:HD domain-containing protein [Spirochaetaceae bacterium]